MKVTNLKSVDEIHSLDSLDKEGHQYLIFYELGKACEMKKCDNQLDGPPL